MRAAIYGAGSLGTVLGAYITEAGGQIDLINRNKKHVEALRKNGATITGTVQKNVKVKVIFPDEMEGKYDVIFLIIALAGHGILAKYVYANPPTGVPIGEAEQGSMLMYYGGDFVDAMIIFILCLQWYKAARPRVAFQQEKSSNVRG